MIARRLRQNVSRLRRDEGGNVAVVLAVAIVPVLGLVGAAVEYSRSSDHQRRLHRAADTAALAAAKHRNASLERKREIARSVFEASMGMQPSGDPAKPADRSPDGLENVWMRLDPVANGVRVEVGGEVRYQFGAFVGKPTGRVSSFAEAVTIQNATEVALVLDNTGSMKNDMASLRRAATQFTEALFANANEDLLRIAVVPYVAAVNPGRANLPTAWLDTGANSRWHGQALRNRTIGQMSACDPDPFPKPVVVSEPKPDKDGGDKPRTETRTQPEEPREQDRPPKGKDREKNAAIEPLRTLGEIALELFGVRPAQAQLTPRTDAPAIGVNVNPGPPYRTDASPVILPDGFRHDDPPCGELENPSRISHFDLFDRIEGARWKGCVEARPEPYDVTDEAPSAFKPDTLFVPYFWPDEPGKFENSAYANTYMEDGVLPPGWINSRNNDNHGRHFANLFKYQRSNRAQINEGAPTTTGPNASCPDEVLPLTNQKAAVLDKVRSLKHWNGGGTINSEGVMWGWRVLSPTAPFTEGAAYDGKTRKYLVLMSDGLNSFVENNAGGPTKSDYTAYGYLRNGRLPSDWFSKGEEYLDGRMKLACQNVKAVRNPDDKSAITVMTILFRETDANTINLLRECASDPKYFFQASNDLELRRTFDEIAGEIGRLRISR